ncbi:MAG: hypothetical protein ACK5TH_02085 [Prosthecobacter sp.]|jgi:hypothetical protein
MSVAKPNFAPPAILEAALHTIHRACVMARNCTLPGHEDVSKANSLLEAVHEIPNLLSNWGKDRLPEIQNHFACFESQEWPGSTDLTVAFMERLDANKEAGL